MSGSRLLCMLAGASLLVLAAGAPQAFAQSPSEAPPGVPVGQDALSSRELERMLAPLSDGSIDVRRSAAAALEALGADAVGAMGNKLGELRHGSADIRSAAMHAVRDRANKDAAFDLVEVLVEQRPDTPNTRALATACLIRALARIGTTPAARFLVSVAQDAGGAFRPELTRQFRQMGDRGVAALVEARRGSTPEVRTWAATALDSLGKRTPGDAVQTKDNQALADVLQAYAATHDMDAAPVVLSFVNSDRSQVRTAAREATIAYGQDVLWKLRDAYAVLTGEQAPDGISAADLAKKLFAAYDRYRQKDVYDLLDHGLAAQRDGHLEVAISDFDQVLAREPLLDRRAEMAAAYLTAGESLQAKDRAAALPLLRKALRLDEAGAQSSRARSDIKCIEGEDLLARGIPDTEPFEQALALDPNNAAARAELDRLHAQSAGWRASSLRLVAAGALLAIAVAGIVMFGGRRLPRSRKGPLPQ